MTSTSMFDDEGIDRLVTMLEQRLGNSLADRVVAKLRQQPAPDAHHHRPDPEDRLLPLAAIREAIQPNEWPNDRSLRRWLAKMIRARQPIARGDGTANLADVRKALWRLGQAKNRPASEIARENEAANTRRGKPNGPRRVAAPQTK